MRSFREQLPTTTLLVMNQSSPVISLSRISTPEQGTVKLSSSLPSGVISDGEHGQKLPTPSPSGSSPKELVGVSAPQTVSLFLNLVSCLKNLKNLQFLQWLRQIYSPGDIARFHLTSLTMMNSSQRVQSIPALGELFSVMGLQAISLHP